MATIPAGAWVMIGDGEKALFLRNDGDAASPNLTVVREENSTSPPAPHHAADAGGGEQAHGGVQDPPFHRLEKDRFAKEVAAILYKAAHRGEYENLIVAAPPHVLGELRKAFHKEVESRLLFDVAKELTNRPVGDIEKALAVA